MLIGEHSAILLTFIKLPFVINISFFIFESQFYAGFTVFQNNFKHLQNETLYCGIANGLMQKCQLFYSLVSTEVKN